jgi:predicted MFS family arabinose efflux permease
MVVVGFGLIQAAAVCNTVIQSLVSDDKRARVMGYYTMAFFGAAPFGSLMAGALAQHIGAPHTVMLTGTFCIAGAAWFTLQLPKIRPEMRASYRDKELSAARAAAEEAREAARHASASIPNPNTSSAPPHQRLMSIPNER